MDINTDQHKDNLFVIRLLFKDQPEFPKINTVNKMVEKYLGDAEVLDKTQNYCSYILKNYCVNFDNEEINPVVTIFSPLSFKNIDNYSFNSKFGEYKYQVIVMDIMLNLVNLKDRIIFTMNLIEMLVYMFPKCGAIYFENLKKLFLIENFKDKNELKILASKGIML